MYHRKGIDMARRPADQIPIERVQTGVRMEKRLIKVLKGIAEAGDYSLGELLEIMALHAMARAHTFSEKDLAMIEKFKEIYQLDYDVHSYERFHEG